MPQHWKTYKLGDISTEISYGYTASASSDSVGPKFLRITDIQQSHISWENVPFCPISEKDFVKYKLKIGDIVIARTGNSTGENAIVKDEIDAVFASYLIRYQIDTIIADPLYVSYVLRSKKWFDYVDAIKGGSAQPGANAQQFAQFPISLPPLPEQRAIASILSALDDKIELNLQMNKTLEEMAMALYKHWFVDFGPFKDGKFVESELGMIPEGWEVKTLSLITEKITDGAHHSPKSVDDGFPMASVKDMTDWDINIETCRKISLEDYEKLVSSGCKPLANDILIAKDGSWLKHCFVVEDELELAILSSIAIIRVNDLISSYLLNMYLKLPETKTRLESFVTGAVIQRIVLKDFRNFKVLVPPKEEQEKVLKQITPLFKKCWSNNQENKLLIQQRDSLLPKLISGEIKLDTNG